MKKLILACTCIILSYSCSNNTTSPNNANVKQLSILQDSLINLLSAFQIEKDSSLLKQAAIVNEEMLVLDTTAVGKLRFYSMKAQLLSFEGKKLESFLAKDKGIPRDKTNIDRLTYDGLVYKLKLNTDSANYYFALALDQCNRRLQKNSDDATAFISMIGIYLYQGEKDRAAKAIDAALVKQPDSQILTDLKTNLDNMSGEVDRFFEEVKL